MPNSGFAFGDQPALDEIAHTDLLLDALAERERLDLDDPQVDALALLMGDWRDDLRWPPASALVSPEEALEALHAGLTERRRTHRGVAAIGSVAATLLMVSGFGALVADAHRGDPLYGLHVMFFDAPRVNDDTVTLSAKADLAKIQQMIDQGQWAQAQNQLSEVNSTVQAMNDSSSRQNLLDEIDLLNTRVESRNPNAMLPAPATKPKASWVAPASPPEVVPPSVAASVPASIPPAPSAPPPQGHHRHHGKTEPSVTPSAGP
jgi:hypothetical protein